MLQTAKSKSKNPNSSPSFSTLFALKPRQVLLAEQSCRTVAAMAKNQNQTVTLTPDQTTDLIHSVLGFVERNGFSKTLKRFLSEAQIQDDNWKKNSVALENIYSKYLRTCSSVDNKCGTKDVEPMNVITKKDEEYNSATSKENANKKKKKKQDKGDQNAVMGQSGTTEKITYSFTDSEKKSSDDVANESNVVIREKKKSKKLEQNSEASNEASGRKACELQEGSTKKHKEKKKKSHLTSESVDVTAEQKKLDLLPEVTLDGPEDIVSSKGDDKVDFEAKSRTKDKKRKSKVVDSEVENGGQQPLENKKGVLTEKLGNDEKCSKVKKRKKEAAATDGVKVEVGEKHTEENTAEIDYKDEIMQQLANMADDKKCGSKKRKRSTVEGNEDQLNEKIASEEAKCSKTEGSDEAKSLEQQTKVKAEDGKFSYNEPQKVSVKQPNEKANNNIGKNGGEESASQNSAKSKLNGSAEPKTVHAFQRVKVENVLFADERLRDNSYWAKGGADVGYGAKAQEVLGQVRGRDFRHEKTKKKRASYRGGQIDLQSHSIKFNYSDQE